MRQLENKQVIAIDGGNGAGKSTVAAGLSTLCKEAGARALAFNSGDIYRVITLLSKEAARQAKRGKPSSPSGAPYIQRAREAQLDIVDGEVYLRGKAVRRPLFRDLEISQLVSYVSCIPGVRDYVTDLVIKQCNDFCGFVILDGRDIGTVVAPGARVKLFLEATDEVKAARQGITVEEAHRRDHLDTNRGHAPLRRAADAQRIDTSYLSKEAMVSLAHDCLIRGFPELAEVFV